MRGRQEQREGKEGGREGEGGRGRGREEEEDRRAEGIRRGGGREGEK